MSKTVFNISEVSKLTGKSRTTIHRYIRTGKLSTVHNEQGAKKVDLSELLRVFPDIRIEQTEQSKSVQSEQSVTVNDTVSDVTLLKQKIEHLEQMLLSKDEHIETLKKSLNLLEHKKEKKKKLWFF